MTDAAPTAPDLDEMMRQYRASPTRALRNAVVESAQPIADAVARRYLRRGESFDDLRQVGCMALIGAVERYDPSYGVPFAAFAAISVSGQLKRHFRDSMWWVRVPRRLQELNANLAIGIEHLEHRLGRSPTADELATELRASRDDVIDALAADQWYRPAPFPATEPTLRANDRSQGAVDRDLVQALRALDRDDRTLLYLRYFEDCTQAEIGDRLGLRQVAVSRRIRAALQRLSQHSAVA
jgi:RNA polymerase sigma-B factor